jgi:hypothetical protein
MQQQLSTAQIHKLKRMTLLVGMVASDGIVLAADQRMVQPATQEGELDDCEGICKIVTWQNHKIAYARVGDRISKMVGTRLSEHLEAGKFNFNNIGPSLETLAIEVRDEEQRLSPRKPFDGQERSLLVVFYGTPERQLWRLRITPPDIAAERIPTISIQGALGNTARFFCSYYRPNLPISKLLPLASHIVLMGHRIDSLMVEGLDIATFDSDGFHFLSEDQKAPLRERSTRLDVLSRKRLMT